jgi:hypothetical protein
MLPRVYRAANKGIELETGETVDPVKSDDRYEGDLFNRNPERACGVTAVYGRARGFAMNALL